MEIRGTMQMTNPEIAIRLCIRQVKVIEYAIKNHISPNDIRCNELLERLIVKQQQYVQKAGKKPTKESFIMLNLIRKRLYDN
jgi:hypothetical protein